MKNEERVVGGLIDALEDCYKAFVWSPLDNANISIAFSLILKHFLENDVLSVEAENRLMSIVLCKYIGARAVFEQRDPNWGL